MIIRAETFGDWLRANFSKGNLGEIVVHGADAGWPNLTCYRDTCKLYTKFREEIWQVLGDMAEDRGYKNTWAMIAESKYAGLDDADQAENLLVWLAAEAIAEELLEPGDDPARDALANHEVMKGE